MAARSLMLMSHLASRKIRAYGLSRKLRLIFFFYVMSGDVEVYSGVAAAAVGSTMRVCILFRIYRPPPTQTMCQSIEL